MHNSNSRQVVEFILLGPEDDRRQLQDSPILGDVWMEYAAAPGEAVDLLITPYKDRSSGLVAAALADHLDTEGAPDVPDIAYLQGVVAARLKFPQLIRYVVPMTRWWQDQRMDEAIRSGDLKAIDGDIAGVLKGAYEALHTPRRQSQAPHPAMLDARKRYITLAGLILWAGRNAEEGIDPIADLIKGDGGNLDAAARGAAEAVIGMYAKGKAGGVAGSVYSVSLNRRTGLALTRSVPAVKADAARTLFKVDCSEIVWAVVDSGIDATHAAFKDKQGNVRVKRAFDFTRIRQIVSLANRAQGRAEASARTLLGLNLKSPPQPEQAAVQALRDLANDAANGRSIDWSLVEPFVEIDPQRDKGSSHGTHVAGIIGANAEGGKEGGGKAAASEERGDRADGMCPDITLYDFRVLGSSLKETEFAVIAALQYIRYLNERNHFITIHGANLSLSIPHDVRNYACGRTPICSECERLVNSGVVVVAAAGNRGYHNFQTKEGGLYEGYAAFSVTDPGNADEVITVGATHRFWPHTYGVSFFSSRGPTGDGRTKPDLVAPGERIRAPLPDGNWGDLDGTSMAAPHVSGAAAMLMARYSELIGQPRRIKRILCESATDLGREKSFQGHGMLDVLRAFQKI